MRICEDIREESSLDESSDSFVYTRSFLGLGTGLEVTSAIVGRPVLGSRRILGTDFESRIRMRRGWFSRLE